MKLSLSQADFDIEHAVRVKVKFDLILKKEF